MQSYNYPTAKSLYLLLILIFATSAQVLIGQNQSGSSEQENYVYSWPDVKPIARNLSEVTQRIHAQLPAVSLVSHRQIVVHILVNDRGNYIKHWLPQRVRPELNQALNKALPRLSFQPAILMDKNVTAWTKVILDL